MTELSNRHIKAAQLEAAGMKAVEIAEVVGVKPQTISTYRRLDEYNILVSKLARATFRASQMRLIEGSQKAVETIIESLDSEKENVRLRAAESLLKMVGMTHVEQEIGAPSMAELIANKSPLDFEDLKIIHRDLDEYLDQCGV